MDESLGDAFGDVFGEVFARVLDVLPDAVLIVDDDGQILEANAVTFELFGYGPADLIGQSVDLLVSQPARAAHVGNRTQFSAAPRSRAMGLGLELYAERADGSRFPVDISLSPIRTRDGIATIAVVRDLTERRQWQDRHESEASSALNSTFDAYLAMDSNSVVTAWNTAAEQMYGWPRELVLGRPLPDTVVPDRMGAAIAKRWYLLAQSAKTTQSEQLSESIACRRDGTEFPVEVAVALTGDGEQLRVHVFVRDISARKAATAEQALLASIVRCNQDGISAVDLQGNITVWNPMMEKIYGFTSAEVIGESIAKVTPPNAMDAAAASVEASLTGTDVHVEFEQRRKDGSTFLAAVTTSAIISATGTISGASAIVRDVTAERAGA